MKIEYDPKKSDKNARERNLPFDLVADMEWETAHIEEDTRKEYREKRFVACSYLFGRFHTCCFTPIAGGIRVISFRRGNQKEEKKYEKEAADQQRG
jgi:uncharacterized DUF497 family protein